MLNSPLEDDFEDIIGKARYGKGWSLSDLARRSSLTEKRIADLEEGAVPESTEIALLASPLKLDHKKLTLIAHAAWAPEKGYQCDLFNNGVSPKGMIHVIDGRIGSYPVNGYIFIDWEHRQSVLFDTGYSPDRVIRFLRRMKLQLVAICITHAHPDHIGGVEHIQKETGALIYLHSTEMSFQMKRLKWMVQMEEGTTIPVGRFQVEARETPGHTMGGTTYLIPSSPELVYPIAFVGDALFAGSLGRAQSSASYPLLLRSVRNKILSLPNNTLLFPGHGPLTSVKEERLHNPFFDFDQ